MPPNDTDNEPARWRMIEATNGYDADNGWFQDRVPVVRDPSRRHRSRFGDAVARRLLDLRQRSSPVR